MISYEFGTWGLGFVFQLEGSVFQRSMLFAVPSGLFAYVLRTEVLPRLDLVHTEGTKSLVSLWGSFTFILGFLLVFRTQIAYGRFWDGCNALTRVRSVWFNAVSNLFAFSSSAANKAADVEVFQHTLVRLFSLLHLSALQEVAIMQDDDFEILGDDGFDVRSLIFLQQSADRLEVVLQWIQRLIVNMHSRGTIEIAPPILSRVFQELSNGVADVNKAGVITEYPFPFPYAQMLSLMLLLHLMVNPVVCAMALETGTEAALVTFASVLGFWTMNYIAAEIEMPFGDDANDLPVQQLQDGFNRRLCTLLSPLAQHPPDFAYAPSYHNPVLPIKVEESIIAAITRSVDATASGDSPHVLAAANTQAVDEFSATFSEAMTTPGGMTAKPSTGHALMGMTAAHSCISKRRNEHWMTTNAHGWKKRISVSTPQNIERFAGKVEGRRISAIAHTAENSNNEPWTPAEGSSWSKPIGDDKFDLSKPATLPPEITEVSECGYDNIPDPPQHSPFTPPPAVAPDKFLMAKPTAG